MIEAVVILIIAHIISGDLRDMMSSDENIVASGVTLLGDGVSVSWSDGRRCLYPYRYLRLQCSCAGCVEEMTGRSLLNVAAVPDDVIIVDFIEVGKYALQFLWSDGHSTGIYPFRMLLRLAGEDDAVICESS